MVGICSIKSTIPTVMGQWGMQANQYPFHPMGIKLQMVMERKPLPVLKIWCKCPSESEEDIRRFREKLKESPFQVFIRVPLHYPRFTKAEYEVMPEWRIELLLQEYGLPLKGSLQDKRDSAISAFLFPAQLLDEEQENVSSFGS
ncbi:hypothetical protein SUGI_0647550 [Cryptomeria japonica]|nr:hypothetical protein SUGI_0647550 [Cryptomeria japonica]